MDFMAYKRCLCSRWGGAGSMTLQTQNVDGNFTGLISISVFSSLILPSLVLILIHWW